MDSEILFSLLFYGVNDIDSEVYSISSLFHFFKYSNLSYEIIFKLVPYLQKDHIWGFIPLLQSLFKRDSGELFQLIISKCEVSNLEYLLISLRGLFHRVEICRKSSMIKLCTLLGLTTGNYNMFVFDGDQIASLGDLTEPVSQLLVILILNYIFII